MSLLRRKRRQNRLEIITKPATRETRFSLESVPVRGLRNIFGRKFAEQRKSNRPTPLDNLLNRRTLRLDINRDVRQIQELNRYNAIRARTAREFRKPLSTIMLDGTIRVDLPPEHPLCVARQVRRAVIFATDKAGKGGQRPREQEQIKLRCK